MVRWLDYTISAKGLQVIDCAQSCYYNPGMMTLRPWYFIRLITILGLLGLILAATGCAAAQPIAPAAARQQVINAWQADQQAVWALDWPAVPVAGPVTAAVWRNGPNLRLEILEAAAPALLGQTLIVRGAAAWHTNRFDRPPQPQPSAPALPPLTDAFALIESTLAQTPTTASRQAVGTVAHGPAEVIRLGYPGGHSLTAWLHRETGLLLRLDLAVEAGQLSLQAHRVEPLPNPPAGLFDPPADK